jgi:hypothetical protein
MKWRIPWEIYLALWSLGLLFAVSWLPLWKFSPRPFGSGFFPNVTLWDFLRGLPEEMRRPPPSMPTNTLMIPDESHLWDNVLVSLGVLAVGAALGAAWRLPRRTRP